MAKFELAELPSSPPGEELEERFPGGLLVLLLRSLPELWSEDVANIDGVSEDRSTESVETGEGGLEDCSLEILCVTFPLETVGCSRIKASNAGL